MHDAVQRLAHAKNLMKRFRFMRSSPSNQIADRKSARAWLRADVPESLGSTGVGIVPAVTRSRRRACPRHRGSGCNEADSCSGRDRATWTPPVCGAYPSAGANTGPHARAHTRRADHGCASHRSHATARPARNSTATPDDDHLLDIAGSKILKFCARHWTAQRMGRRAERHRGQRQNNCGRTSHDGLRFLIQQSDNLLVSGRHSALSTAGVERISGGNGQAERMTVVYCIANSAVILGDGRKGARLWITAVSAGPPSRRRRMCGCVLRFLRKSARGCAGRPPRTTVPS